MTIVDGGWNGLAIHRSATDCGTEGMMGRHSIEPITTSFPTLLCQYSEHGCQGQVPGPSEQRRKDVGRSSPTSCSKRASNGGLRYHELLGACR